jgi:hypothetical protein
MTFFANKLARLNVIIPESVKNNIEQNKQLTSSIRCFLYNVHICNRIMSKYTSICMSCILLRKAKFIQSNENDKFVQETPSLYKVMAMVYMNTTRSGL